MRMRRDMRVPPGAGPVAGPQCYARGTPECEGSAPLPSPRSARRRRPGPAPERAGGAARGLQPQLLAHDPRDLATVGAALRLAHDEPDDHADRLHVALAQLLDDVRIGLEGPPDDRLERVAAPDTAEPPGPDGRARVPALGDEPVEHLLGRVLRHLARGDHADERRERTRLD